MFKCSYIHCLVDVDRVIGGIKMLYIRKKNKVGLMAITPVKGKFPVHSEISPLGPTYLEQLTISMLGPSHGWPPQAGAGLSHERILQRQMPMLEPSTCVQGFHSDQDPKEPSTVKFLVWKPRDRSLSWC